MIGQQIFHRCNIEGFKEKEVYEAYKMFFGNFVLKSRFEIINLLREKEMNVSEIASTLNIDQSTVSHNLTALSNYGVVFSKRKGKFSYYRLNNKTILPLMNLIERYIEENGYFLIKELKQ